MVHRHLLGPELSWDLSELPETYCACGCLGKAPMEEYWEIPPERLQFRLKHPHLANPR